MNTPNSVGEGQKKSKWIRKWEITLAILAMMDLCSCLLPMAGITLPEIYSPPMLRLKTESKGLSLHSSSRIVLPQDNQTNLNTYGIASTTMSQFSSRFWFTEAKSETFAQENSNVEEEQSYLFGYYKSFMRFASPSTSEINPSSPSSSSSSTPRNFQEITSKIFVLALCIHAVYTSWSKTLAQQIATSFHKQTPTIGSGYWRQNTKLCIVFLVTLCLHLAIVPLIKTSSLPYIEYEKVKSGWESFCHIFPYPFSKTVAKATITKARFVSLGEAVLLKFNVWFKSSALLHLKKKWNAFLVQRSKKIAAFAVQNPLEFHFRYKQVMVYLRWTRLLFPLIGLCNKLKGHLSDLIKKWKQCKRAKRAKDLWKSVLKSLTAEQRFEMAVIRIQSNFRATQERKAVELLRDMKKKEEQDIELKIRNVLCAQANLVKKRMATSRLQNTIEGRKRVVSKEDRASFIIMKEELRGRSLADRTLLLKPNTTFSVIWKTITVTCISIEVFLLVYSYFYLGKNNSSLDQVIERLLLPSSPCEVPTSTFDSYVQWAQNLIVHGGESVSRLFPGIISVAVSPKPICQYNSLSSKMISTFVKYFAKTVFLTMRVVSFLDVFITFFTGEIAESNGALIPKPFITRWLLPGIALQLLVNPSMKEVYSYTKRFIKFCNDTGPSRVFHAALALYPIVHIVFFKILDCLAHFVRQQNLPIRRSSFAFRRSQLTL